MELEPNGDNSIESLVLLFRNVLRWTSFCCRASFNRTKCWRSMRSTKSECFPVYLLQPLRDEGPEKRH